MGGENLSNWSEDILRSDPRQIINRPTELRFSELEMEVLAGLTQEIWEDRLKLRSEAGIGSAETHINVEQLQYIQSVWPDVEPRMMLPKNEQPLSSDYYLVTSQTDFNKLGLFAALGFDLKYRGVEDLTVVAKYLPCERGDREAVVRDFREVFMLQPVVSYLSTFTNRLMRIEGHSPVLTWLGLKFNLSILDLSAQPLLIRGAEERGWLDGDKIVAVSDEGAVPGGRSLARSLGADLVIGDKDKSTGKTVVTFPENLPDLVRGKTVVLREDVIATGGTMDDTVFDLEQAEAGSIVILTTHAIFASQALPLFSGRRGLYIVTTDTRQSMANLDYAPNIRVMPTTEKLMSLIEVDKAGLSPWSLEGRQQINECGFDLASWMLQ